MKIAFVVPSLANKGPIIVVKNLVDYLISQKIYCEVFYFDNIKELNFNCKTNHISFYNFSAIKNFDILHSHGIRPDLYSFLNPYKIKRVSTLHNYIAKDLKYSLGYSKKKAKFFEFLWNIFLSKMDKIIVLSQDAKKYYLNILFNKNLEVIYNGLEEIVFNEKLINKEDEKIILDIKTNNYKIIGSIALLTKRKGLHQIIELLKYDKTLFYIIIGDGPEKNKLIKLSKELKVNNRCLFLGYRKDAKQYLQFFDYFAIPSYSEGFPLALIEAVSVKIPILASNINVHREAFNENEISFFELDNLQSLFIAYNYLKEKKNYLINNAYNRYLNNYTLEKMGQNNLNLYKKLLGL